MNFYFRRICASMSFCVALMATSGVNAALVNTDLVSGSGDGLVTRDTDSGLDWLDVPLTTNQTFDQVRTGSYYQQGFRHATADELRTLFMHAGIPDDGYDISVTHPTEAQAIMTLLGMTTSSAGRSSTYGFTGNDYFGNVVTTTNYPIGAQFSALLGKIDFIDLTAAGLGLIGEGHFTGGHPFSDQADPSYGSFLVRPVSPVDAASPILSIPADITANATSPSGATVSYVVTATDSIDPHPTVNCTPASGSTFPVGTTAIACTATDASGNIAKANFNVRVKGALDQISDLIALVKSFNIKQGIESSLDAKLQNAYDALYAVSTGMIGNAGNKLDSFINEVHAQTGKALTTAQANQLIAAANSVKASLGIL